MARIRSIKPETFTSETLAGCSVHARWTFAGLWCYVDDEGRGKANAGLIKAAVWPLDEDLTPKQIDGFLDELEAAHLVCRYEVDGKSYLHVVNFGEHQHPNRPVASKLPACSRRTHGGLSEPSPRTPPKHAAPPAEAPEPQSAPKQARSTRTSRDSAGQDALTDNSLNPHGARTTKSSMTPPTPTTYVRGDGVGDGDGVQQAAPAAADELRLTVTQRSKRITDAYAQAEPMCKWPAVNGVVIKAIQAEKWADEEIREALLRMAKENRSVTIDSLRTELAGMPPARSNGRGPAAQRPIPPDVSPRDEHRLRR